VSTAVKTGIDIRPFHVEISDEALDDLRRRIGATRWPTRELVADRSQGVQLATMQELARYWTSEYDWRRCEARLNALPQFKTEIDGVDIHFIHVKSPHEGALPLIMTHGWPGSVIELLGVVEPLTDPTAHGGSAADAWPRGRRRSATPCWIHPSGSQPGCSTTTRTATRRSPAPFSAVSPRGISPPTGSWTTSRCTG
jgi:hypothetical protein